MSDYYYAADQSGWTLVGHDDDATKDYRAAANDNWMYMGMHEWTISRNSDSSDNVFRVGSTGGVFTTTTTGSNIGGRPVFNLDSTVSYESGSGTQYDPIRIN